MSVKDLFDYFVSLGLTPEGTAGLLANIRAESAFNPKNLQNSYNKKLNMTDDEYTAKVDDGSYKNFVRDAAGYGLVQWTYWSRKQNLLNFAKEKGLSIGDMKMQAAFTYKELSGYKSLIAFLQKTDNLEEACDRVMTEYERPADQSEMAKKTRRMYAREIFAECSSSGEQKKITEKEVRQKVVDTAVMWLGRNEADRSHRDIVDIYNGFQPLARGYKVTYTDAWCATFVSAVAIWSGYTDIIPRECSCGKMIELFQILRRWVESDAYVPEPGDVIFYDWQDSGAGENTAWPDHVGIVAEVSADGTISVIEGNMNDAVGYRTIKVNGRYIRGYGIPDYASKATTVDTEDVEVSETPVTPEETGPGTVPGTTETTGTTETPGTTTQSKLSMNPSWVGVVTADTLNVRKWGGTEYAKLKSIPTLKKGDIVEVCDKVKSSKGETWLYVRIDGRVYGFVHADHIQEQKSSGTAVEKLKVGQTVEFAGNTHYASTNAASGKKCLPGKAKITAIYESGKHPYHLVNVKGGGSTVYGWVDSIDIKQ